MQERLHIDDLKRIEKQMNTLLKSWQQLTKDNAQLEEKQAVLNEALLKLKTNHSEELSQLERHQSETEANHKLALNEAVTDERRRWQQKYDETCAAHEAQLNELNEAHQNELRALRDEMAQKEQTLTSELERVNKVKDALSNRVLGVNE